MNTQGQIVLSSERCSLIERTIRKYDCKKIVEIGTWKGMGSTICILNSKSEDSQFITIESNKSFYDTAIDNLKKYQDRYQPIYGSIVSVDEIESFVSNISLEPHKQEWLKEDLNNTMSCPDVLQHIFNEIDFLLLDGGEFSTYKEWLKLKDRTNIVALDDIVEIKTSKIYGELIVDTEYEFIEKTDEGNGFCIFKKK